MGNKIYNSHKGVALLLVVILTFALSIIALTFLTMINIDIKDVNIQYQNMQAFYTAEAGIEKGLWRLNNGMFSNFEEELDNTKKYQVKIVSIGSNRKKIKSYGIIKNKELSVVSIEVEDNPLTFVIDYSFIPGTWERIK